MSEEFETKTINQKISYEIFFLFFEESIPLDTDF